jgi:hypothetical protein
MIVSYIREEIKGLNDFDFDLVYYLLPNEQ